MHFSPKNDIIKENFYFVKNKMMTKLNSPQNSPISKIGDKIKKVAVGAALLGTLTACNTNESGNAEKASNNFEPKIEQNDKVQDFVELEDNSREVVEKEYLRLKSLIGKKIFPVKIDDMMTIYCESARESDNLYKNRNNKDVKQDPELWTTAKKWAPFTLTEETLKGIMLEYAQNPYISVNESEIWAELLEEKNKE